MRDGPTACISKKNSRLRHHGWAERGQTAATVSGWLSEGRVAERGRDLGILRCC